MVKLSYAMNFIKKYENQFIDFDGWFGSQCVDLIMFYIYNLFGFKTWGNAIDYTNNALPKYFQRHMDKNDIKIGDIIVLDMRPLHNFGHIGIVIGINGNMLITLECNVDGNTDALTVGGRCRRVTRNRNGIVAVIRPPYEYDLDNINKYPLVKEFAKFTLTVDRINIRTEPTLKGKIVAFYEKGDTVIYDGYIINDGFVWISWIGSQSKTRVYMAIGEHNGNNRTSVWGTFTIV